MEGFRLTPIKVTKHYKEYREEINTDFDGFIVDIETIGNFRKMSIQIPPQGQEFLGRFQEMKITTVGILSNKEMRIIIANGTSALQQFQRKAVRV